MPAVGKVSLDIRDYEKSLEQVRKDTIQALKEMERQAPKTGGAFADVGKKLGKTGSLISAVSSEAGGAFGKLGNIIGAVTSGPVMALTAAIGGLVALGVQVWDKMTLSAEEYAAKLDRAAQAADKHREAVEKQVSEDQTYMDRLQELASKEQLSNEAKAEAAALLRNLTSRYGDLGISIDKVTGKIGGMDKAQAAFLKKVRKMRMQAVSEQLGSTERRARNEAQRATAGMFIGEETLNKIGLGWKSADEAKSAVADVMESGNTKKQILMAERLRDASSTTEDADRWQKVIDSLQKVRDLQREYNLLVETGRASEKEAAESMKKKTDAAQSKVDAELAARKKAEQAAADTIADLQLQLDMQDKLNDGLADEAEKLKIISNLRNKGITDPDKVAEIVGLSQRLSDKKFAGKQRDQAQSLYMRALQAAGKDYDVAIAAAKKEKGGLLTDEETNRTINMVNLSRALENASQAPNFGDLAIRTNSLTARGGFASGAVAPDADKYARAQVEQGKQMLSIVSRIERLCADSRTF